MSDLTVANTILEQMGGRQFIIMTGARNLVGDINSLRFSLTGAKDEINKVIIRLEPSDTYTVSFYKMRDHGTSLYLVSEHSDIYFDVLQDVFERATGLYTTLNPRN